MSELLPKSPEERKAYIGFLKEAELQELSKKSCAGRLSDIKAEVKERFEISSKDFTEAVKLWMDDGLAHDLLAEAEDKVAVNEILHNLDK